MIKEFFILNKYWYYKIDKKISKDLFKLILNKYDKYSDFYEVCNENKKEINKEKSQENIKILDIKDNIKYIKINYFDFELLDILDLKNIFNEDYEYIIDLRECLGGSLSVALSFCDFLLTKTKFILEFKKKSNTVYIGNRKTPLNIFCLISKNTISSGELVAGLIKESNLNNSLIGDSYTYGKNLIQKDIVIKNNNLKLTISKFKFFNIGDIENSGIKPDYIIPRYVFNYIERLVFIDEIKIGDTNTNIISLQKIINILLDNDIMYNVNGICSYKNIKDALIILNKELKDYLDYDDLRNLYRRYLNFISSIEFDNQIKSILNGDLIYE